MKFLILNGHRSMLPNENYILPCNKAAKFAKIDNSYTQLSILFLFNLTMNYIETNLGGESVIIVAAYHSPRGNHVIFLQKLDSLFEELLHSYCYTKVVGGDFNININWGDTYNYYTKSLRTITADNGFTQLVIEDTHVTKDKSTH